MVSEILKEYINSFDAVISTFKYNTNYPFFIKVECLLEKNNEKELECEYKFDNITFTKKFYKNSKLLEYLSDIDSDKGEEFHSNNFKGKLDLDPNNNGDSLVEIILKDLFYGQTNNYFNIEIEKPLRTIFYKLLLNNGFFKNDHEILLEKDEGKFFPKSRIAFNNLMELNMDSVYNGILFLIPLHKRHFKNIELSENNVKLELNEPSKNELLGIYYSKGSIYDSNIIKFIDKVDLKFSPDYLEIILIDDDYHILDRRKWSRNYQNNQYGIMYRYSEDEIDRLFQLKEESCLERKSFPNYDIIKIKENKQDLIETIVAFSNCKGGKILIGVEDIIDEPDKIKGFDDTLPFDVLKKNFEQMIRSHCNPNIEFNLSLDPIKNGKKILIMDIPEGNKKPYVWNFKNTYKVFIRNGESDIQCNREELINLCCNNDDNINRIDFDNDILNSKT